MPVFYFNLKLVSPKMTSWNWLCISEPSIWCLLRTLPLWWCWLHYISSKGAVQIHRNWLKVLRIFTVSELTRVNLYSNLRVYQVRIHSLLEVGTVPKKTNFVYLASYWTVDNTSAEYAVDKLRFWVLNTFSNGNLKYLHQNPNCSSSKIFIFCLSTTVIWWNGNSVGKFHLFVSV